MIISLVGMSGVGKSFWSKKLEEELSYQRICCDDLIEERLAEELKAFGYSGIADVSRWLGQPWEKDFQRHQMHYLIAERKVMKGVIAQLRTIAMRATANDASQDIVLDTTGSLIYVGEDILSSLRTLSRVIHFQTPSHILDEKISQYLEDPKPLIWGQIYQEYYAEERMQSLEQSYSELLLLRERHYLKLAECSILFEEHQEEHFGSRDIIDKLQ